ncbi:MAG: hypothetical protein F4X69_15925 [Gemmatimonadetes bacterium]|nr:hypothetical protein [Gemmatimonadota bacterium]
MDYEEYKEQQIIKEERRERCRWCKDAIQWANSAAETLDSSRNEVRKLRNQVKAAASRYAETGNPEAQEAARFLISQMVDMLEDYCDMRM